MRILEVEPKACIDLLGPGRVFIHVPLHHNMHRGDHRFRRGFYLRSNACSEMCSDRQGMLCWPEPPQWLGLGSVPAAAQLVCAACLPSNFRRGFPAAQLQRERTRPELPTTCFFTSILCNSQNSFTFTSISWCANIDTCELEAAKATVGRVASLSVTMIDFRYRFPCFFTLSTNTKLCTKPATIFTSLAVVSVIAPIALHR